jgi:molybdenum cofactor cytidylyltransferase
VIGAVVLAAGGSSRLGRPKQLLWHRGRSLLRRAAEEALASGCEPVVVVLGAEAGRLAPELAGLPVKPVVNERWADGMSTSLRLGVEALGPVVEACVLLLCDQPSVTAALLRGLVEAHRHGHRLAGCEYGDALGVPALFDRSLFPELLNLGGDRGARPVLAAHAAEAARIAFPEGVLDIDTPEDAARLAGAGS